MIKSIFSDDNALKSRVLITSAYVSCPKDESSEHKGFFIMVGDNPEGVKKFFGAMEVQVTQVDPLKVVLEPHT